MTHLLATLVHQFGLVALFAAVGLESMGVPVPAETALVVLSTYAAHAHLWSPWLVFGVTATAAVLGDNAGYLIGRFGGWPLLRRYGHLFRLDERRLKTARYLFVRHGGPVVAGGRFVVVLRTTAAFLAGVNHMPWPRFLAWNLLGGLAWSGVWTAIAFTAGHQLSGGTGFLGYAALAVAASAVATGFVLLRRRWGRIADAAEAAYPGPLH